MTTRYVAARFAALVLLLFLPLQAFSYYNASTGSWLSRDPIEERGCGNVYCFAENRPIARFDIDGRLNLQEFPTQLPARPTQGPYAGYGGLTWFNAFEPDARVYKSINERCCWKIFLPGQVDLYYWWVKDAPGHESGTTAQQHEMQHVAAHRDTYNGFKSAASAYIDVCYTERKTECWKSVINGPLKAAYLARNHVANLQIDAWYRGDEVTAAIQDETAAWDTLTKEEQKCASME